MANFFTDNEDLLYYVDQGIDWRPLVEASERGIPSAEAPGTPEEAVALYRDMAEMIGEFAAEEIAPNVAEMDREGVRLEDGEAVLPAKMDALFERIRDLDLHWLSLPRELGGMNCPNLVYFINAELFARADVSVMAHHGFHSGIATALLLFSIREGTTRFRDMEIESTRFRKEIEEIARGEAWGTMDITEPDAGSDMARLRTTAVQDEQGTWLVTGEKIFITSGHGKYHFVIARTESPEAAPGLEGLSFFLVPTYEDGPDGERRRIVKIARVEEKLGHHGSATCALTFDRAPAMLIGKRGEGFKYMLVLMNMARLGVGFESIGLCEASYRLARDYAAVRPSMGKTIDRHEMIADYLEEMQTDIQGLRALAMHGAYHEELAQKLRIFADHDEHNPAKTRDYVRRKAQKHAEESRRVTPLLKYLAAEKAVEIARRALQIHGGNGYITEYGAEKLLRDALVMPIYEGTSQIQALMAMKDTLGAVLKQPQLYLRKAAQARWRSLSARDPLERRVAKLQVIALDVEQYLIRKTATDKFRAMQDRPFTEWTRAFFKDWDPKRDFAYAMLHAERLTRLLADVEICEILLAQAQRHEARREVLSRYLTRAEPRCRYLHDVITTTGAQLLSRLADAEESAPEAAQ